jgi:hypothetical protein
MHYQNFEDLLTRSTELAETVAEFLMLSPYESSAKITTSRTLCEVSFEHAESVRILISTGNFTSSLGVLRMQYESLVKAVWALYAASDTSLKKLQSELNNESAKWADKVPPLSEILSELEGKAPPQAVGPLREFKEYSWKPLSSYIHGGIHAISRRSKGYPKPLLEQAVRSSNGLLLMTGMNLVILSGDSSHSGKVAAIQKRFADCCPNLRADGASAHETP